MPQQASPVRTIEPTEILTIEKNKWYHFEVFIKERYEEKQHPFMEIKVDDSVVFQSRKANSFNDRLGGELQYGIYKNNWRELTTVERYFDNWRVEY